MEIKYFNSKKEQVAEEINNPFKGPESFTDSDKDAFYGRDREITDLVQLIDQYTLTMLYSKSGVGKTSVINAGLVPLLGKYRNYLPVYVRLNKNWPNLSESVVAAIKHAAAQYKVEIYTNTPFNLQYSITNFIYYSKFYTKKINSQIFKIETFELKNIPPEKIQVKRVEQHPVKSGEINGTEETSTNNKLKFVESLYGFEKQIGENIKSGRYTEIIPVLIFDQFEEIFTLDFDSKSLKTFLDDITFVIESRIPEEFYQFFEKNEFHKKQFNIHKLRLQNAEKWYRILFSFREEYLASFESLKEIIPTLFYSNGRYQLETFTPQTANDVIIKTSARSISIPKDLANQLTVAICKTETKSGTGKFKNEVHPFLLSLICKELYPKITAKDSKVIDELKATNFSSVDKIISDYCTRVFKRVPSRIKSFVEDALITKDGKRMMYPLPDLSEKTEKHIKVLMDPRLRYLNTVEYFETTNIEILHDKLVHPLVVSRKEREKRNNFLRLALITAGISAIFLGIITYKSNQEKKIRETQRKYELFLNEINVVILKNLDTTIKMNSIAAMGPMMRYDSILNKAFDNMPEIIDSFQKKVLERYEGRPLFFIFNSTGTQYKYSKTAMYRYYVKKTEDTSRKNMNEKKIPNLDNIPINSSLAIEKYESGFYTPFAEIPMKYFKDDIGDEKEMGVVFSNDDSLLLTHTDENFSVYKAGELSVKQNQPYRTGKFPLKQIIYNGPIFSNDRNLIIFNVGSFKYRAYSIITDTYLKENIIASSTAFLGYNMAFFLNKNKMLSYVVPQKALNYINSYDLNRNTTYEYLFYSPDRKYKMTASRFYYIGKGHYVLGDSIKTYLIKPDLDTVRLNISSSRDVQMLQNGNLLVLGIEGNLMVYSMETHQIIDSTDNIRIDSAKFKYLWCHISPNEKHAVLTYYNNSIKDYQYSSSDTMYVKVIDLNKMKLIQSSLFASGVMTQFNFYKNDLVRLIVYNRNYSTYDKIARQGENIDYINWYYQSEPPKRFDSLKIMYNKFKKTYPDSLVNVK